MRRAIKANFLQKHFPDLKAFLCSPETRRQNLEPNYKFMIATKESFEPHSSEQLPNSKRVYVAGKLHPDVRVPMREIALTPTKSFQRRRSKQTSRCASMIAPGRGAIRISPARPKKACPRCGATGFCSAATWRNTTAAK